MDKKMNNEELLSRREFFKKAAKAALPMLAAVALANVPTIVKASETVPNGCNFGCSSSCSGRCSGTCYGGCELGCKGSCMGGCGSACSTSCTTSCRGGCYQGCTSLLKY